MSQQHNGSLASEAASLYLQALHLLLEEGEISWMTLDEMRAGRMVDGMDLYFRVYLDGDVNEIWYERDGDGWIEVLK